VTTLDTLFADYGQSPWLDDVGADTLGGATLSHLVTRGVRGAVVTVPAITRSLVGASCDDEIGRSHVRDLERLYEDILARVARDACDELSGVYHESRQEFLAGSRRHCDGFVSLAMPPRFVHNSAAIVEGATRLRDAVARENVLVTVAATTEGLKAIPQLLAEGVGLNVTAVFSTARYLEVLSAWKSGIELALARGRDVSVVGCTTSTALAPVDVVIDSLLTIHDRRRGTAAVSLAAAIYEKYRSCFESRPGLALLDQGAQVPRPTWTATTPTNAKYFDLLYVNYLAVRETVLAMSDVTLAQAFDHGDFTKTLLATKRTVRKTTFLMKDLPRGIVHARVADKLERDFLAQDALHYDEMLTALLAKTGR
jgi:transaldolase